MSDGLFHAIFTAFKGLLFPSSRVPVVYGPVRPVGPSITYPQTGNVTVWENTAKSIDNIYFAGWFQKKRLIDLVAAMVMVESSGGKFRSRRVSVKDTSYGPMQVTPYTAGDIFKRGYKAFQPTETELTGTAGGMYYGMAYVKILYEVYGRKSYEEITKAYNGGPGYARSEKAIAQVSIHWSKVKQYV